MLCGVQVNHIQRPPMNQSTRSDYLAAKVKAVNSAHTHAKRVFALLAPVFAPFVGQQIETAPGPLLAKLKKLLPDLPDIRGTSSIQVFRESSPYSLRWTVKACESVNPSGCVYYEVSVYIGDMRGGVFVKAYDAAHSVDGWRTDYTAEEIAGKHAAVKAAEDALSEAKSALWPFNERDN